MDNMHTIKPFNPGFNKILRDRYQQSLERPVSYDGGKTVRPRVRHAHAVWAKLPDSSVGKDITPHPNTWVWSDLHFGHKNIIQFSDRPFPDIETMNEHLILNHNDYVQPEDISIWVGDVAFYSDDKANQILRRCNGYKILVIGNHDINKKKLKNLDFDEVHVVYNLTIDDRFVAFTHYPMDNLPETWFNIHGHIHVGGKNELNSVQHINVNCEFHQYKPVNLDKIADWIQGRAAEQQIIPVNFDYTEYD